MKRRRPSQQPNPAQKKLADALRRMKELQDAGKGVFRTTEFTRLQRETLKRNGFIQPIIKGWYLASRPDEASGETTPWFAAMPSFVAVYCTERFGDDWYVAPGYSLHLHAGATVLPKQVIVHSAKASNSVLELPNGCTLVDYRPPDYPISERIQIVNGLRALPVEVAMVRVSDAFFATSPDDAQILLAGIQDASDINRELLAGGHSSVAGRIAGAFRAVGKENLANDVVATMRAAGYTVQETNPFTVTPPQLIRERAQSPYVLRLHLMWTRMRTDVLQEFPEDPGLPADKTSYMHDVEEGYKADAYHSLSIEGYRVTTELIERVASGAWNPEDHARDADARNALAAHGYWRAFNEVKSSLKAVLAGRNAGTVSRDDHGAWYRALFAPFVEAGILNTADLAGYRNAPVYIRNASHVPPSRDAVRDMMPALFDLVTNEPSGGVRAVLGHFCFVFIHPYMDGNGRTGRFLMNVMLASGGFPWTVIPVEQRREYMSALDDASARGNIRPLARLIAANMRRPNSN